MVMCTVHVLNFRWCFRIIPYAAHGTVPVVWTAFGHSPICAHCCSRYCMWMCPLVFLKINSLFICFTLLEFAPWKSFFNGKFIFIKKTHTHKNKVSEKEADPTLTKEIQQLAGHKIRERRRDHSVCFKSLYLKSVLTCLIVFPSESIINND